MQPELSCISLDGLETALDKYNRIMSALHKSDVSTDRGFQKLYNGYYRMRQRKPEFYDEYYRFMEANKNSELMFSEILLHFYETFGRVEASFSSKLLATIDPHQPVYDSRVLAQLQIKKNFYSSKDRVNKTIKVYESICAWYRDFLQTEAAREWLRLFDERYPDSDLTDVKKIDFILWKMEAEPSDMRYPEIEERWIGFEE